MRNAEFCCMEHRVVDLAKRLRDALQSVQGRFGLEADALMPFDRPTPASALASGLRVRYAGVVLTVFLKNNEWQVALMKRTEYPGVHSGQISIPGGEFEEFDENLRQTAVREFEEEMGVRIPASDLIEGLSDRFIPPSSFSVSTFIAVLDREPVWKIDPLEVANVVVVPVRHLIDPGALIPTPIELQPGVSVKLPAFHWQAEVIWGATAIILTEFALVWRALGQMD